MRDAGLLAQHTVLPLGKGEVEGDGQLNDER